MKVFVINLESSVERRRRMEAALAALGLPFEIIAAVDGRASFAPDNLPHYNGTLRRLTAGGDLTPGEMGCILSHRAIYSRMVKDDIPCAVVLEDDAILSADFPAVLEQLQNIPLHWDMVRFLGREKCERENRPVLPLDETHTLTRVIKPFGGAYAYMLTQKAAARFLTFTEKNWLPIDMLHGHTWRTGLEVFAVAPSPARADNDIESTIEVKRWDKRNHLQSWQKFAYPLTRSLYKLYLLAGNTYMRLKTLPRDRALQKTRTNG